MKKIVAKVGQYTNAQGETKNNWVDVGVIMENQNGEYIMLNPTVDLAGVLIKQRIMAQKTNGKSGDNVMCSIFDESTRTEQPAQNHQRSQPAPPVDDFQDDIPFDQPYRQTWRMV